MSSENRGSGTSTDTLATAESTGFLNVCYRDTATSALGRLLPDTTGSHWLITVFRGCPFGARACKKHLRVNLEDRTCCPHR